MNVTTYLGRKYKVYGFSHHDPILDKLVMLAKAARIKPKDWSRNSGVSLATIYVIIGTVDKDGVKRYCNFPTIMRLCIGLGVSLSELDLPVRGRVRVTHNERMAVRH